MNSANLNADYGRIAIWVLIAINALFFIAASMNPEVLNDFALHNGSTRQLIQSLPTELTNEFQDRINTIPNFHFIQILTAAFLHKDFSHLLFNMWGLFLFGSIIIPRVGNRGIVVLYLFGAITGNLLYLLLNFGNFSTLLGASGAICALMSAAAILEPDRRLVFIFMPTKPMKMLTVVIVYTILELLLTFGNLNDGIAHLAHLGGFLGGFIAVMLFYRNQGARPIFQKKSNPLKNACDTDSDLIPPEKFNELLEKLAKDGINALTEEEIKQIRKVREKIIKH